MWTEIESRALVDNKIVGETIWYHGNCSDIKKYSLDWRFHVVAKKRLQARFVGTMPHLIQMRTSTLNELRKLFNP